MTDRIPSAVPGPGELSEAELAQRLQARRQWLGDTDFAYDPPLEPVRGDGVYLFDSAGQRYLDMHSSVPSMGHGHPEVVSAVAAQAATLNIHARHLNNVVEAYAARLLGLFPAPLGNLVMTCSGSEANDLALRLARLVTGGKGIIVTSGARHGSTATTAEISPGLGQPLPAHVRTIPPPDPSLAKGAALGPWFAARVREEANVLQKTGAGFAALVLESGFAFDGVFTDPPGFLTEAVSAARQAGGLFIADEVQTGFGRTGMFWGFSRHGVVPDVVTLGKPMGNGYPMGGVVMRAQHLARLNASAPYISGCGGSPVAAAAGMAVLDVIETEKLVRNAVRSGEALRKGLRRLARSFPRIAAIRGAGLLIAVDLVTPETGAPDPGAARRAINALQRNFVLVGSATPCGHTLQLRPPLSISAEQVAQFLEIFGGVLATLE
ncbi:MAG: aminotransferase class III-fold pyridoxal phosphate-dependent enzyme [Rhodospirillales bacterium]|nr:aminotransferase class III-fold pyridoxal phosphate-dependent enzyme [Rhodospirillales bacterium]MDE2458109.1 aminotransferase class III-fold pyridoxal phosphate-dependent enzyme [Rhodospirillales bacterium]